MQGMGQDQPSHRLIANLQIYKFTNLQIYKFTNLQVYKSNISLGQHNNMALDKPERWCGTKLTDRYFASVYGGRKPADSP